jgi:Amt family ammonium transporter
MMHFCFGAKAWLLFCVLLYAPQGVEQNSTESSPPPLFSERTEDQVARLLANAPPGEDDGSQTGLKVFRSDRFSTGHQLAFLIASCACLCLIAPGSLMIFSAVQGAGHASMQEKISQVVVTLGLLSLSWILFVYSIAFSRNAHSYDIQQHEIQVLDRASAPGNLFIGDLNNWGMRGLLSEWGGEFVSHPMRRAGDSIPHSLFMTFQMMLFLQAVAPLLAIFSGSLKGWTAFPLWLLWSVFVYSPLCYWTLGGGWLADCEDAGATVPLHIAVGFTALGLSFFKQRLTESIQPSAGQSLLPTGGLLFLGGSLLVAGCRSVSSAPWPTLDLLNVFLGGVVGVLIWLLAAQRSHHMLAIDWPLGMISGIVSVTAGCASMPPTSAIIVGVVGVVACCLVLNTRRSRPTVYWLLFATYGVSGVVGLTLAGVFSSPDIGGADIAGRPIVGLIAGDLELLRVQLLTAAVSAMLAFGGGLVLPHIAAAIGYVLQMLFSRKLSTTGSLEKEISSIV